jgi:hypothetical protein
VAALAASCAATTSAPQQNLDASDYFVIVTEGLARERGLGEQPPTVHIDVEGRVGARFALYNMGKRGAVSVTLSAAYVAADLATKQPRQCVGSTVVNAGAPDGVEKGRTWESGQVMFPFDDRPCPPCAAGTCKGSITIAFVNHIVSSENGTPQTEVVPVSHTFTFELPAQ